METDNIISIDSIQVIPDEFARLEERVAQAIKNGHMVDIRQAILKRNQFRDQFSPPVPQERPAIVRAGVISESGQPAVRSRRVVTFQS